jgi:putative nucleotidyltransferase with HDIG domain
MKHIFDKIHGMIVLTPLMLAFIDTPEFQRLRQIKQLGTAQFIFPTANHTRFDHSIGVAHLARTMATHLKLSDKEVELISLAGLLHDIGHGPLSHSFDKFLEESGQMELTKHEDRSIAIIRMMVKKYNIELPSWNVQFICNMIKPSSERTYRNDIISGEYDMDRFDYILRDSTYTIQIRFNSNTALHIIKASYIDDNRIKYRESNSVMNALEGFKNDRLYMYKHVYNNPKCKIIDESITKIMVASFSSSEISLEDFLQFPFIDAFLEYYYANPKNVEHKKLIENLFMRKL